MTGRMKRVARVGIALTLAAVLAACGSNQGADGGLGTKQLLAQLKNRNVDPTPLTQQQIAEALQATPNPVAMFVFEKRKNAQGLLLEIETNGPYHSFGNSARNVIVMRNGMITSTRGLGGDLMSSDEEALLSLVRSRSAGTATYVQRFLTPEGVTEELTYRCTTRTGGGQQVAAGLVNAPTVMVHASCEGDSNYLGAGSSFANDYAVSGDGVILSARQWVGDYMGYVGSQYLRR